MSQSSPVLALPYIQPSQAQKHVTHNDALEILDQVVQLAVASRSVPNPPAHPGHGARYLVPGSAAASWGGQAGHLAVFDGVSWQFRAPRPGWRACILDEDILVVFDGTDWILPRLGTAYAEQIGVNAASDPENRLAVASGASLFTHEGAGHQVKVNKAAPADTASLLFQTGFSGRAEIGIAGNDNLAVKVSEDGTSWRDGLIISGASGTISAPNGLDAASLSRAGSPVYARTTLLGLVSQSGGVPTGAVIERGSNVNGQYVRLADGTQICVSADFSGVDVLTAVGSLFRNASPLSWSFPALFGGGVGSVAGAVISMGNSQTHWGVLRINGAANGEISVFGPGATAGRTVRACAIGRWF